MELTHFDEKEIARLSFFFNILMRREMLAW